MHRTSVLAAPIALALGLASVVSALFFSGCSGSGGGADPTLDLFVSGFLEDGRVNLERDHVLTFEFTTGVDPASINGDTLQIFRQIGSRVIPFPGRYEVDGSTVRFHPVVDEGDPGRGALPLNPFGFDENQSYRVVIPSIEDTPSPLETIRDPAGNPIIRSSKHVFAVGAAFRPDAGRPNPTFAAWSTAAATATTDDDVLQYLPVPDTNAPPLNPVTNQPDYRAGHPSAVQLQLSFSDVIDPRSIRTGATGNVRLEFFNPATTSWTFVASTVAPRPNGRDWLITAATPLGHEDRANHYRLVLDQAARQITSRAGRALIERVADGATSRPLSPDDLKIWTAKAVGEDGPKLTSVFPIEPFVRDLANSDTDVSFRPGLIEAGPVVLRTSEDTTPCTVTSVCSGQFFREPLTQSLTSGNPNPNAIGPSKIQMQFNSYQHALNRPAYKLTDAEVLSEMYWSPANGIVFQATYPKLHIFVDSTIRDASSPRPPAVLPSGNYDQNVGPTAPGFPARDGETPYVIPTSSANITWYPWKFEQPFARYHADKGLIFTAWTEVGGEVEQYADFYWIGSAADHTMVLSRPSANVNPTIGTRNFHTFYWTKFEFKRMRSIATTKFIRMTAKATDEPIWARPVVSPIPTNQPGGTVVRMEYRGAKFTTYNAVQVGGRTYHVGVGSPTQSTAWTTNLTDLDGFPAVAVRFLFEANVDQPNDLPTVDGLSFTFSL